MALFRQFRGKRVGLSTQELHDGYAYFCTDDGTFHIDYIDDDGNLQRKQINSNEAENVINAIAVDSTALNTMLEEVLV